MAKRSPWSNSLDRSVPVLRGLGVLLLGCTRPAVERVALGAQDCPRMMPAIAEFLEASERDLNFVVCGPHVFDGMGEARSRLAMDERCDRDGCREWSVSFEEAGTTLLTVRFRSPPGKASLPAGKVYRLTWSLDGERPRIVKHEVAIRY